MRFGKMAMFFLINGIIALFMIFYLGRWLYSSPTMGDVILPFHPDRIEIVYSAGGKEYRGSYLRGDVPLRSTQVAVRYLNHNPAVSRIDTFLGIYAEPLAWWGILIFATSLLFFTNNAVFSKGTTFHFQKKYPWIFLEEYFPVKTKYRWYEKGNSASKQSDKELLN